jgi:RNA polymerase sigma factor (sigma-70 family)
VDRPVERGLVALESLVRTDYLRLVRAVALSCGSARLAEDATQEALARAWQRAANGEEFSSLTGWLVVVASNDARSRQRREQAEQRAVRRMSDGQIAPRTADPHGAAELGDVRDAVDCLPPRQRQVVVLFSFLTFARSWMASRFLNRDVDDFRIGRSVSRSTDARHASTVTTMNQEHLDLLASDDWRAMLRDLILPSAFAGRSPADLGDDVLEIGPGPGLTTEWLSGEIEQLTALELDPVLAADLARRHEGTSGLRVFEGDATSMPFEADRFTGVVSFTMLHHVPDVDHQDRLFAEANRVLRPGGLLVASDSVASDDLAALHDDDVYNPVDPAGLEARLVGAGFVDVDVDWNDFGWRAQALAG